MILGIETSCDETSVALLNDQGEVLSNVVASQAIHELYDGVVPELASREHVQKMLPVLDRALAEADVGLDDVDAIAVTSGPGLVGSLLVGVTTAKGLALARDLPLLGVNHLEAHALSPFLEARDLEPPVLVLVVSGGHTLLVHVKALGELEVVGRTRDDAAGEAYDKVSVMLGLGYPGGPELERLAKNGDATAFDFPRSWLEPDTLDFSFSGIKTAVRVVLDRDEELRREPRSRDVAASFQAAVVEVLVTRTLAAAERLGVPSVAIAGGVAANGALRSAMETACRETRRRLVIPRLAYCGDNAAMIAHAGKLRLDRGERSDFSLDAQPNLPLGDVPNRAPSRKKRPR
ncbi:MAG: tRNA N6-adenosine threonylcarbamoyltransferase [Gemmatimonadota bacterium]|nr:MAG: tRNA N6-adenosine threonylcarbamoyltransferase [Gemmatimonadota bacterium]